MQYEYILKHLRPKKKRSKTIKIFLYALGLAICHGGIAGRILTLMQDSEEKKTDREFISSLYMPLRSARIESKRGNRQLHTPTNTLPENRTKCVNMP